ncbi:MAG: hypothetical protein FK733_18355 [Asgard group archaeon]|nr:hypothetical protein [Asgard group archaeon]
MHDEEINQIHKNQTSVVRCAICNKIITENDLVHVSLDETNEFIAHFNCYVELQDKICSECGLPFYNQEEILFCEDHKQYFHESSSCIMKHLSKHTRFQKAKYDATNNRIVIQDSFDSLAEL